jgi:lysophospholipase
MNSAASPSSIEARARLEVETLTHRAGRLRLALLRPAERPRGTVLILSGRGEFIEKYASLMHELGSWGLACAKLDWRGQGGSGRLIGHPRKGHVGDFAHYLDDLELLLRRLATERLPEPRLVIAHSMGGHIALRAMGEGRLQVKAAVLVAPMFDIRFEPLPRWFVRSVAASAVRWGLAERYAPGQGDSDPRLCRFPGNPITGDRERFMAWQALLAEHTELRLGGVTFGWLDAALRSIELTRSPAFLRRIDTPLLIAKAGAERIVSNGAIDEFVRHLPDARVLVYPDAAHDLFWEGPAIREPLMREIRRFLARVMRRT